MLKHYFIFRFEFSIYFFIYPLLFSFLTFYCVVSVYILVFFSFRLQNEWVNCKNVPFKLPCPNLFVAFHSQTFYDHWFVYFVSLPIKRFACSDLSVEVWNRLFQKDPGFQHFRFPRTKTENEIKKRLAFQKHFLLISKWHIYTKGNKPICSNYIYNSLAKHWIGAGRISFPKIKDSH